MRRVADDEAFEGSVRHKDADGRLHVAITNISKANICGYAGSEIPDAEKLGLKPDQVYKLYRDPAELAKGAATFNNIPLLNRHVAIHVGDYDPADIVGSTGTDAQFIAPYLRNSLVIWNDVSIAGIETDQQKQISCAYRYRAVMEPGEADGAKYDGRMVDIVGNHVALVETGRAGSDVVVGDSLEISRMALSRTALSRRAAVVRGGLAVYLKPKLAADAKIDFKPIMELAMDGRPFAAAKPAIVVALKAATEGKLAKDATMADITDMLDNLEDSIEEAVTGEEGEGEGREAEDEDDETEEERKKRLEKRAEDKKAADAKGAKDRKTARDAKKAKDAFPDKDDDDDDDKKEKAKDAKGMDKKAMDAAISDAETRTVARMNAIRAAEIAVRPAIGDLAMALDSADAVYRLALDTLGVDTKGIHASAFPAMLKMKMASKSNDHQRQTAFAMDAESVSSFEAAFPNAARIKL